MSHLSSELKKISQARIQYEAGRKQSSSTLKMEICSSETSVVFSTDYIALYLRRQNSSRKKTVSNGRFRLLSALYHINNKYD
jgi:hypothetical protein